MIGFSGFEDGFIDGFHRVFPKQFFSQTSFKKLSSRKPRDDEWNFLFESDFGAQSVNRLKTSIAHIAVLLQTIDKNLIHGRSLAKDMLDAQLIHYPPDVRFRLV